MNPVLLSMLAGCGGLGVYTYAGYPTALWVLGRHRRVTPTVFPAEWPSISIVIPAYNEEESIGRTLNRILEADYPADRRQIVVVSDASTDRSWKR